MSHDGWRDAARFGSIDEIELCITVQIGFPVGALALTLDEHEARRLAGLITHLFPGVPHMHIHLRPIIEAAALEVLVLQAEPQGLDQMQPCSGGEA